MFARSWLLISLFTMPQKFCRNCQSLRALHFPVWKVLGLLLVLADTIDTSEVFFNTKGGTVKAYLRTIKACERG